MPIGVVHLLEMVEVYEQQNEISPMRPMSGLPVASQFDIVEEPPSVG